MPPTAFPRKKKRLLIEYLDASGQRRTAFTRDLSMSGFYVLAEAMPAVGKEQAMKLHLARGVMEIRVKVIRTGRGTTQVEGSAPKGFAVALSDYCEPYARLVESL